MQFLKTPEKRGCQKRQHGCQVSRFWLISGQLWPLLSWKWVYPCFWQKFTKTCKSGNLVGASCAITGQKLIKIWILGNRVAVSGNPVFWCFWKLHSLIPLLKKHRYTHFQLNNGDNMPEINKKSGNLATMLPYLATLFFWCYSKWHSSIPHLQKHGYTHFYLLNGHIWA